MNNLNHLKKLMVRTVLKEGTVSSEEKERIFQVAVSQKKSVKRPVFAPVLSVAASFALFSVIGVYGYNQMADKESEKPGVEQVSGGSATSQSQKISNETNTIPPHFTDYHYVAHNGYFYKLTKEKISEKNLGEIVGEVKRVGHQVFKKEGDSSYLVPGSLYSIKGKDKETFLAGAEVDYTTGKQVKNEYRVFERYEKISQPKEEDIMASTSFDTVKPIVEKIQKKMNSFYSIDGLGKRTELWEVTYVDGPFIKQQFRFKEGDQQPGVQGYITAHQYRKGLTIGESRFNNLSADIEQEGKWKQPELLESLEANGIKWGVYKDRNIQGTIHKDLFLKGESSEFEFEIVFQGDATLEVIKEIASHYKIIK